MTPTTDAPPRSPGVDADPGAAGLRPRWALVALMAGGAAAVALRLRMLLVGRSLWLDEAALALNVCGRSFAGLLRPLDHDQAAPIGFLFAERASVEAFGPGEVALRLYPFLASIASVALIYRLCAADLGRWAGAVAVALMAAMPGLVYYSGELKQYSGDVAWALLILVLASGALRRGPTAGRVAALAASGAVAVWFSHPSVFVLAGAGSTLIAREAIARRYRPMLIWAAVSAAWLASFAAEYLLFLRALEGSNFLVDFWDSAFLKFPPRSAGDLRVDLAVGLGVFEAPFGNPLSDVDLSARMGIFLAAAWAVGAVVLYREGRRETLALLVAPLCFAAAASMLHKYPLKGRLALFTAASTLPVVAAGIAGLLGSRDGTRRAIGAILLIGSLTLPAAQGAQFLAERPRLHAARAVLAHLAGGWEPGDVVVVDRYADLPLRYYQAYGRVEGLDRVAITRTELSLTEPGDLAREIARWRGRPRVWIVLDAALPDPANPSRLALKVLLDLNGERIDSATSRRYSAHLYDFTDAPSPRPARPPGAGGLTPAAAIPDRIPASRVRSGGPEGTSAMREPTGGTRAGRDRAGIAVAAAVGAAGLVMLHHPMILSGLGRMQGDLADTRLINYLLEHNYLWYLGAKGHGRFWDPPFFYPAANIAAYSDTMLGIAPLYAAIRALGLAPDTSFQLWMLALSALNYAVMLHLLARRVGLSLAGASAGAFLFAFGAPRANMLAQQTQMTQFLSLIGVDALFGVFAGSITSRGGRGLAWIVAAAGMLAQLSSAFYPGWFMVLAFGIAGLLAAWMPSTRGPFLATLRRDAAWIALAAFLAGLAARPWLAHHLEAARLLGPRWSQFAWRAQPRPIRWLDSGPGNWVGGRLAGLLGIRVSRLDPLAMPLGVGPATTAAALAGLYLGRRDAATRLLATVGLVLGLLLTILPEPVVIGSKLLLILGPVAFAHAGRREHPRAFLGVVGVVLLLLVAKRVHGDHLIGAGLATLVLAGSAFVGRSGDAREGFALGSLVLGLAWALFPAASIFGPAAATGATLAAGSAVAGRRSRAWLEGAFLAGFVGFSAPITYASRPDALLIALAAPVAALAASRSPARPPAGWLPHAALVGFAAEIVFLQGGLGLAVLLQPRPGRELDDLRLAGRPDRPDPRGRRPRPGGRRPPGPGAARARCWARPDLPDRAGDDHALVRQAGEPRGDRRPRPAGRLRLRGVLLHARGVAEPGPVEPRRHVGRPRPVAADAQRLFRPHAEGVEGDRRARRLHPGQPPRPDPRDAGLEGRRRPRRRRGPVDRRARRPARAVRRVRRPGVATDGRQAGAGSLTAEVGDGFAGGASIPA